MAKPKTNLLRSVACAAGLMFLLASATVAAPIYDVIALGPLAGSRGQAINGTGQVAGFSRSSESSPESAHLWSGAAATNLGTLPGGAQSFAFGINDSGAVVGYSATTPGVGDFRAFLYTGGALQDLGSLEVNRLSAANDINNNGLIVGFAETSLGTSAFYYDSASPTPSLVALGVLPGGTISIANSVNDAGIIAGTGNSPVGARGFRWNGAFSELLPLTGDFASDARSINLSGVIAGFSTGPTTFRAVIWESGSNTPTDLGAGTGSIANGINDAGFVVGNQNGSGFLWNGYSVLMIQDLVAQPGWEILEASAINNLGQIVAYGRNASLGIDAQALLLTPQAETNPIPEPASLLLVGLPLGLLILRRRKRTA